MKNQGEIISLIVFVILTIALGVTTYFGFKGLAAQKAELATAQSELNNVKSENETLTADVAAAKRAVGFNEAMKSSDIVAAMTKDVEDALGENAGSKTYKDAVADLKKSISAMDAKIAGLAADRDKQIKDALSSIDLAGEQQKTFGANVDAAQSQQDANLATARKDYDDLTNQFVEKTKEFDSVSYDARKSVLVARAETTENKELADRFAEINLDLGRRIDELTNVEFKSADGSVVYADQVARTVRLDVGVDDGIRPLMTFNVYPPEVYDEGGVPSKGTIQVVRTMESHACEAKILSDDSLTPIQPGDLIYTSFWKRGEVERYAFDFRLDVNNDGYSDLNELINLVESNGFEVAAYLDDTGKLHGKITPDVTRVVVPNFPLSSILSADAKMTDAERATYLAAETDFLKTAKANGVREMRLDDFLVRMDYKATEQVVRNAKDPSEVDAFDTGVADAPVAPVFNSGDRVSGSESTGVNKGAVTVPSADSDESAAKYFRKRAPNL